MRLRLTSLLSALVVALALASCTPQPPDASSASVAADAQSAQPIRFGLNNNISSGLPVLHPAIMILDKGAVTAFRAGSPDADEALAAIKAGEQVQDTQDRQQDIQAAFGRLLDMENMALDAVADPDGKTIILFSPDEVVGGCTQCAELFAGLEAGGVVAGFSIQHAVIEHR